MTSIILGTAQFGAGYGVTNRQGRLDDESVLAIVRAAIDGGIAVFDSAPDYGDAQDRLGRLVPVKQRPAYVTKFGLSSGPPNAALYEASLRSLGVDQLYGLLYHRVADLRDPRIAASWEILQIARDSGVVRRIGASIYDVEDLEVALEVLPGLDLLQIPGNVLDRRLLDHPEVQALRARGCEIHVRSAYLQGLLLTSESVPHRFAPIAEAAAEVARVAERSGSSLSCALLGFLKHHPAVDSVVLGALSSEELETSLTAWHEAPELPLPVFDIEPGLLDPRTWSEPLAR